MHRLTDQLFSIDVGGKEIMLKEYCFGTNCKQGFYLIDSNILIAMGNLYYKGKCKSEELKNEIIDFILTARRYGVQNQFALVELCYDYNTNQINTEAMQKIMIAYDNLLTSMSDDEIVNHKGGGDFCISNKDKQQNGYMGIANVYFREMENISYHVAAGHIDEELLTELMTAILDNTYDNDEALKLKLFNAISVEGQFYE